MVDRPNLFIKIPATLEGLPAITAVLAEGISVNVTLIFSLDRYRAVMDAYLAGLEQARGDGHDLSAIASVASFFVSRVDTEIDKRLDEIGTDEALALRGKAAIANARLAYQRLRGGLRRAALAGAGRRRAPRPQRRCGPPPASRTRTTATPCTSTSWSPPARSTRCRRRRCDAVADHGEVTGDTVRGALRRGRRAARPAGRARHRLRRGHRRARGEGVDKFEKSWGELLSTVRRAGPGGDRRVGRGGRPVTDR